MKPAVMTSYMPEMMSTLSPTLIPADCPDADSELSVRPRFDSVGEDDDVAALLGVLAAWAEPTLALGGDEKNAAPEDPDRPLGRRNSPATRKSVSPLS